MSIYKTLNKVYNNLEYKNLYKFADRLNAVIIKIAQEADPEKDDTIPEIDDNSVPEKKENELFKKDEELYRQKYDKALKDHYKELENIETLEQAYIYKDKILTSGIHFEDISQILDLINQRIYELEDELYNKFVLQISKPYFTSDLKKFNEQAILIENDDEFKKMHPRTKEKISYHYKQLKQLLVQRIADRDKKPLLNFDQVNADIENFSNFINQNIEYETNKLLSSKNLGMLQRQDYERGVNFETNKDAKIQELAGVFKSKYNMNDRDAKQQAIFQLQISGPLAKDYLSAQKMLTIYREINEAYLALKLYTSIIYNNALNFAKYGDKINQPTEENLNKLKDALYRSQTDDNDSTVEQAISSMQGVMLPSFSSPIQSEYAPLQNIYTIIKLLEKNFDKLSKNLPVATKLKDTMEKAYTKVDSVLQGNPFKQYDKPSWFEKYPNEEDLGKFPGYNPLYPGSKPPE